MSDRDKKPILEKYGRWAVLREVEPAKGQRMVEVRCECGSVGVRRLAHLRSGASVSCGCWIADRQLKHGQASATPAKRTPEYNAWVSMNQRCENPKNPRWKDYGGRGITVCAAWRDSFEAFYQDMGARPSARHSIDRKANDGNYEPGNCRWATTAEQAGNKRSAAKR